MRINVDDIWGTLVDLLAIFSSLFCGHLNQRRIFLLQMRDRKGMKTLFLLNVNAQNTKRPMRWYFRVQLR
jgi:hypothetical protein